MSFKLEHTFTLILPRPSSCGTSTYVIRIIECRELFCNIVFENIVWCHSENNAPHLLTNVLFVKVVPGIENSEKVPKLLVLDDLMDSAYSTKVSELFTKGSHHRTISLVPITQKLFHQSLSSRVFSLNSKYIVVLEPQRQDLHLARQGYPESISSFHKTYLDFCKNPHTYLLLDLT